MAKKLICILLLISMLCTAAVACTKNGNNGNEGSTKDTEEQTTDVVDTEADTETETETETEAKTEADTESEVEETEPESKDTEAEDTEDEKSEAPTPIMEDFGGYQFRVLTRGDGAWKSDDITGSAGGSRVSIATYNRNAVLKSRHNFEIIEDKNKNWLNIATVKCGSGEDLYDMISVRLNEVPTLGQSGILYNLNEVDGLNIDADYYDQITRHQGTFANYLFFLTGDMIYNDDASTGAIFYNNTIWNENKFTEEYGKDIYGLVRDMEWTFEKMIAMSKKVTVDDGNGVWGTEDYYGCSYTNVAILCFSIGLGNDLLKKDADDIFYMDSGEKIINDLADIFEFFNSGSCMKDYGSFKVGLALFTAGWITSLPTELPNTGIDYGVIPFPMRDEDQENYRSMISAYGSNCITICSSVRDIDKTANIVELISYESLSTLTPALKQWLFEGRGVPRVEDVEMLEIIMDTKTYELCYLWSTGALYSTMINLNNANGEGIKSAMEGCEEAVVASVQRKLDRLNQLA